MANGGTKTTIDPEAVRAIAARMGVLMDDLGPFQQLLSLPAHAGNFSTATWLETLLGDRKKKLSLHAEELKKLMHDVQGSLEKACSNLEQTDKCNADRL
ncbi:hypothetical protein ACFOWZ_27660 [Lentzea rhizosphaerae]|jgi:hypothetical protein|uniref:Excreted virulence factor EspC, type VII ESX diderm n=1 Tax=Lentzea rhizosphaerae TaxID=2041025 RepID=A0ABV8BZX4_9PSEU